MKRTAQRKAEAGYESRQRAEGLKKTCVWVAPQDSGKIIKLAKQLRNKFLKAK